MKIYSFLCVFILSLIAFSCTKSTDVMNKKENKRNFFQVWAIGADTTKTNIMVNSTPNPSDFPANEDQYMKTRIISYTNGKFYLEVTNKQNCQVDFELKYDGTVVSAISPDRKNNVYFNHIAPNATEVFEITGSAKVGHIKVKVLTICNWNGNPKWLMNIIDVVTLPINFTNVSTKKLYNGDYEVKFTIDEPNKIDVVEIHQSIDGKNYTISKQFNCDKKTRDYRLIMKPLQDK